jgi:hypothetical protein
MNIHCINGTSQTEILVHTAQPLVYGPISFEDEIAIENLQRHKSPNSDQIPAELISAGDSTFRCKIR